MKYLLFILSFSTYGQIVDLPNVRLCGDVVRDTLTVSHLEFGNCGQLLMTPNSLLIVETNLFGQGRIVGEGKIIFNSCVDGNDISIADSIEVVNPEGCGTLSVEDVDFDDYIGEFECVVYNVLTQEVYRGKFKEFDPLLHTVYLIKFDGFYIKKIWSS